MFFTPIQQIAAVGLIKNAGDSARDAAENARKAAETLQRIEEQNRQTLARIETQNARIGTPVSENNTGQDETTTRLKEQMLSDLRRLAEKGILTMQEYESQRDKVFNMSNDIRELERSKRKIVAVEFEREMEKSFKNL